MTRYDDKKNPLYYEIAYLPDGKIHWNAVGNHPCRHPDVGDIVKIIEFLPIFDVQEMVLVQEVWDCYKAWLCLDNLRLIFRADSQHEEP